MDFIRYSDNLETLVMSGSPGAGTNNGAGDCVLLDFKNCFFAVADSSSRSLPLSRKLLSQCGPMLDDLSIRGCLNPGVDADALSLLIKTRLEGVLEKHYGEGSCAFTGVLLYKKDSIMKAVLLHTGDTSLLVYDTRAGSSKMLTRSNFWMAGKSRNLYQVEVIDIQRDSWLLLATDGMIDAIRICYGEPGSFFKSRINGNMNDDFFRDLMSLSANGKLYDDAGMILFRPANIRPNSKRIMLGGVIEGADRKREIVCVQ